MSLMIFQPQVVARVYVLYIVDKCASNRDLRGRRHLIVEIIQ